MYTEHVITIVQRAKVIGVVFELVAIKYVSAKNIRVYCTFPDYI